MSASRHLYAVEMGIDTQQEPVVYMRRDCDVCRAEGFTANTRLEIGFNGRTIIATLHVVSEAVLAYEYIGFSQRAWRYLNLHTGAKVSIHHAPVVQSTSAIRKKIYGHSLHEEEISAIIRDISKHYYSDIEIASFLTACAGNRLNVEEISALSMAMVNCGHRLNWPDRQRVFNKHCVGGLPGNRTTPIVIAIASAAGLCIPKTSSRAITSPAGTADTMEVLTNVDLTLPQMQTTVQQTNACLAWGGRVNLSPTDDMLIRVERSLDLDGEGQLVASVLSKKIASGSTHVLIDIPVGPTAKVRSTHQAQHLTRLFEAVAANAGLTLQCVITDGTQTVGYGIGPAEEARDVLAVLQNQPQAPADLRDRAILLAGHLLLMASDGELATAVARAREILLSGKAWQQFQRICNAQGGLKEIPQAPYHTTLTAERSGVLTAMDNRRLARLAKLAGAPSSPVAGLRLAVKNGATLEIGQPLLTLFAESPGELDYATDYYRANRDMLQFKDAP